MGGLQLRRAACCTDIVRPLVIYPGGVDLRVASEVLVSAKGLLRLRDSSGLSLIAKMSEELADLLQRINTEALNEDGTDTGQSAEAVAALARLEQITAERRLKRRQKRQDILAAAARPVSKEYSYLIYPTSTDLLKIEVCHVQTRPEFPALHVCAF